MSFEIDRAINSLRIRVFEASKMRTKVETLTSGSHFREEFFIRMHDSTTGICTAHRKSRLVDGKEGKSGQTIAAKVDDRHEGKAKTLGVDVKELIERFELMICDLHRDFIAVHLSGLIDGKLEDDSMNDELFTSCKASELDGFDRLAFDWKVDLRDDDLAVDLGRVCKVLDESVEIHLGPHELHLFLGM